MGFDRAVVAGGSIAGLLAAAALHGEFDEVVVIERDDLPNGPEHRAGVPQGLQVHALLAGGFEAMESLLPGVGDDLVEAAGRPIDSAAEIAILGSEGWVARVESNAKVVGLRRPEIEYLVRRRALALPNVRLVPGDVVGLVASDDGTDVLGCELRDGTQVLGDLTVDATGRNSNTAKWVAELGHEPPVVRELKSYVGYATVKVRVPDGLLPRGVTGILTPPQPENLHGGALFPCGPEDHLLTALGMMRAYPPDDREGFIGFLDQSPSPILGQVARQVEFVEEISRYRMPGTQRRMWEEMPTRPEGLVAVGDAVMSFNPIYGQGMSVAALEAVAMRDVVASAGPSRMGLAQAIQTGITAPIDAAFQMVVGTDSQYEGAKSVELDPPPDSSVAYRRALAQLATEDAEASLATKYASHYFDMRSLQSDRLREKVEAWMASGRTVRHDDPTTIPDEVLRADIPHEVGA